MLPQYLKPGGTTAIWLCSGYNKWYRFSDQYRKITHRMSSKALHRFFRGAVPVFYWLNRDCARFRWGAHRPPGPCTKCFPVNRDVSAQGCIGYLGLVLTQVPVQAHIRAGVPLVRELRTRSCDGRRDTCGS